VVLNFTLLTFEFLKLSACIPRRVRTKRKLAKMDIPDFESNPNISIDDILRDPMIPHIPQPNLELVERIGRGASGLVWRANWQW
jgi:hypothetical protein